VLVADSTGDLAFWSRTAHGDVAPAKSIFGAPSHLHQAYDLVLRPDGELLVGADGSPDSAVVGHALGATGEATPVRLLTGPSTLLEYSTGVASDRARDCSQGNSTDGCLFRDNFENGQICYWSDSQGGPGCF
jgi:hypothetical protein